MHNYVLIQHNFSQFVIYELKPELKVWKIYNVKKIIILMIIIAGIIILKLYVLFLKFFNYLSMINIFIVMLQEK
jgi:hypothetical protein